MSKQRADEEYESEGPMNALPGHAQRDTSVSPVADNLMQAIMAVASIHIMMDEADPEEWALFAARLQTFKTLVARLPDKPKKRKTLGFRLR